MPLHQNKKDGIKKTPAINKSFCVEKTVLNNLYNAIGPKKKRKLKSTISA